MNHLFYLHWNRRWNDLILHQIPEPVERGEVELQRQVLRPQLEQRLRRPGDLLPEGHAAAGLGRGVLGGRGGRVPEQVLVVGGLGGEAQLEAPGVRRRQGALAPALRAHREFALEQGKQIYYSVHNE